MGSINLRISFCQGSISLEEMHSKAQIAKWTLKAQQLFFLFGSLLWIQRGLWGSETQEGMRKCESWAFRGELAEHKVHLLPRWLECVQCRIICFQCKELKHDMSFPGSHNVLTFQSLSFSLCEISYMASTTRDRWPPVHSLYMGVCELPYLCRLFLLFCGPGNCRDKSIESVKLLSTINCRRIQTHFNSNQWFLNLACIRVILLKYRTLPHSFWFRKSRMESEDIHFYQVPR